MVTIYANLPDGTQIMDIMTFQSGKATVDEKVLNQNHLKVIKYNGWKVEGLGGKSEKPSDKQNESDTKSKKSEA